jgi:hypothetical protein
LGFSANVQEAGVPKSKREGGEGINGTFQLEIS